MKKGARRTLFWIAVLVFIVASWAAIRYAQGYAYDFSTRTFVRTGAVAVTVSTNAALFIDDVKSGETSFLSNRAGEDGLLPGRYELRVARDMFTTWRKNISIEEGRLTDFPHVLILSLDDSDILDQKREASRSFENAKLPVQAGTVTSIRDGDFLLTDGRFYDTRSASPSLIAEHVLGFSRSPDEHQVLWWSRNEAWVLWIRNTDQQPYRIEGERQLITRYSVPIQRAAWFQGSYHIVVDLGNQSYRIVETDARGGTNSIKL